MKGAGGGLRVDPRPPCRKDKQHILSSVTLEEACLFRSAALQLLFPNVLSKFNFFYQFWVKGDKL